MNRYVIIILCALFLVSRLEAQDDLYTEIDKIIRYDTELDYKKTPGFIVTVIDNEEIFHYSFGSKIRKEKEAISPEDIFEIGSVTKIFTASLIVQLINDGLLKENDLVNTYLPAEWRNPRLEHLTISDLIHHRSGFSKRPAFFGKKEKDISDPYAYYKRDDLLKYYRDYIPSQVKFEYSHTNYALLEIIIQHITGKKLQDVMEEKIFSPLNMTNTFIDFPEKKTNFIAPGYNRIQKLTNPWTFASFSGSEGMKASSRDLAKFVKNHLSNLSQNNHTSPSFNDRLGINMGWHAIHMGEFDILTHTGKTSGHNAFIGLVRETKTAVIILSNSSVGTSDLGFQILRMINYNWKRLKV